MKRIGRFMIALTCVMLTGLLISPAMAQNDEVPIDSYDSFRNAVLGNGYDLDGNGYWCFDGAALLWQRLGRSLDSGGQDAKGTWLIDWAREANAGNEFILVWDLQEVRRGDVVVIDGSAGNDWAGHIGFADSDYIPGGPNYMLDQRYENREYFSVHETYYENFLGAFRYKPWDTEPPVIYDYTDVALRLAGKHFYFAVTDNMGVDPSSVKLNVWEHGKTNQAPVTYSASPMGNDVYTVIANIASEMVYYVQPVASDRCGNTARTTLIGPVSFYSVNKSGSGVYIVKDDDTAIHCGPYAKINNVSTKTNTAQKGQKLQVIGSYVNNLDNLWYQLSDGNWVYSENVNKIWTSQGVVAGVLQNFPGSAFCYVNHQFLFHGFADENEPAYDSKEDFCHAITDFEEGVVARLLSLNLIPEAFQFDTSSGVPLHTVTFDGNGGFTSEADMQVYEGNAYGRLPTAERFDYEMTGWYTDPDGGTLVTPGSICAGDTTLYAQWTEAPRQEYDRCGENLTWFYSNDVLTIEGVGAMTSAPWEDANLNASIQRIQLPEGLTEICDSAFTNCTELRSIEIPSTVTRIGSYAYHGCSGATGRLVLPSGLTELGAYAFCNCSGLTGKLTLPSELTSVGDDAFKACGGFTGTLVIPDTVTSIGGYAFSGCGAISELEIPTSVEYLGEGAFNGCSGLTDVTLPVELSIFGVFEGCSNVERIRYTVQETGIMPDRSYYSDNLTLEWVCQERLQSVVFDNGVKCIARYAFHAFWNEEDESCVLRSVTLPDTVESIGDYAFKDNEDAIINGLPASLKAVGAYAFENCKGLTANDLPASLEAVGAYAFENCKGLTPNGLPVGFRTAGESAFYGCGITALTIPAGFTTIPNQCFSSCSALETLVIPDTVTSIGGYAFSGCGGLDSITFLGDLPETAATVFESITADAWYFSLADSWASGVPNLGGDITWHTIEDTLTNRLRLPAMLTDIEDQAFLNTAADMAILSDGVTAIGSKAFGDSDTLRVVLLPANDIDIAADAFSSSDVILFAPAGSAAEAFAEANGIPFLASDWQSRIE